MRPFMFGHFGSALGMEEWRGERRGFKAMNDALARYTVGAFSIPDGCHFLDLYTYGYQDVKGQPAYPNWPTLWKKHGYPYPPGDDGHDVGGYGSGAMMLCAIAMRATCGDAMARSVWRRGVAPAMAKDGKGMQYVFPNGNGFYGGAPWCSAAFAITPVMSL